MSLYFFLPDMALLALALAILTGEVFLRKHVARTSFRIATGGLIAILILLSLFSSLTLPLEGVAFASYRITPSIVLWKQIFVLAALGTVFISSSYFRNGGSARGTLTRPGAFYSLILFSTLGMFALISAGDALTFYLGLELASLPLYALSAFQPHDSQSVEGASKYVLMGAFSSTLSLFGISFLFGAAGGLSFESIGLAAHMNSAQPFLHIGALLLLGGIGFKLSMAPLHMWAPDVYQGSPMPVMAFLSVGSKAAAVAAMTLLFLGPLDALRSGMTGVFSLAAVLSMVVGNLGAMRQSNLRRFVAYSSIAQVGYMLVAFTGTVEGARSALQYNLIAYGATSFAFYFVISLIGKTRSEEITSLQGLSSESPGLAALLVLCMFSLVGIPPLAGFLGKFLLFSTAAQGGHYLLVLIAAMNAVVSFYYYMRLLKEAYISKPTTIFAPIRLNRAAQIWTFILAILLLVLGTCPALGEYIAGRSVF